MTSPVAGLTTSKVWPSAASTCSPPMIIFTLTGVAVVVAGACDSVVMRRF